MMNKYPKLLILTGILIGILFLLILLFLNQNRLKQEQSITLSRPRIIEEKQEEEFVENPQKGDLGYQESNTKIEIGTQGVTKGTFEKVEDGSIYLREGETLTKLPLTVDEVAIQCTTQDLSSATELDFNQVTEVKVATSLELGNLIPAKVNIVVFAQNVEGVNRVHTVAMDSSKCNLQQSPSEL